MLKIYSFILLLTFSKINPCEGRESLLTDMILSTRLEQGNVIMKLIELSKTGKHKGKYFTMVDDDMYDYLNQWNWTTLFSANGRLYAYRTKRGKLIFMHRLILGIVDIKNKYGDHRDHNGLNNQSNNLRICTHAENMRNRTSCGKSKYLGVSLSVINKKRVSKVTGEIKYYTYANRWVAFIWINGSRKYLGRFIIEIDAARAYDEAAKIHHKEFANLNFK